MERLRKLAGNKWLLVGLITVLILGYGAVLASRLIKPQLKSSLQQCQGEKSSDTACYQSYYQQIVAGKGVAAAFGDLKSAYDSRAYTKTNCHQLAHIIGRAAANRYPEVGEAYKQGDNFCWSGYYHGVMETMVTRVGLDSLKAATDDICGSVREGEQRYSFYHYNCVHGLGHGFMAIQGDELFTSLSMCDYLTDSWERESCFGGVFMENIMADINDYHDTQYLRADEPLYPCTAVAQPYQSQCYGMQTSYALKVLGQDFSKVFTLCAGLDTHRATCYQSLGRDASGNSTSDAAQTREKCMLGPDHEARENCVVGAVKDFISYFHGDTQATAFCASLEPALADVCSSTGREYYKVFKS